MPTTTNSASVIFKATCAIWVALVALEILGASWAVGLTAVLLFALTNSDLSLPMPQRRPRSSVSNREFNRKLDDENYPHLLRLAGTVPDESTNFAGWAPTLPANAAANLRTDSESDQR